MIVLKKGPMPRKNKKIDRRRRRDDLRKLSKSSPAYWEEVLRREELAMTAGRNTHRIVYVGDSFDLAGVERAIIGHHGPKRSGVFENRPAE